MSLVAKVAPWAPVVLAVGGITLSLVAVQFNDPKIKFLIRVIAVILGIGTAFSVLLQGPAVIAAVQESLAAAAKLFRLDNGSKIADMERQVKVEAAKAAKAETDARIAKAEAAARVAKAEADARVAKAEAEAKIATARIASGSISKPASSEQPPFKPNAWIERLENRWVQGDGDVLVRLGFSFSDCAQACIQRADCVFLEHHKPEKKCSLFSGVRSSKPSTDADIGTKRFGDRSLVVSSPATFERLPYGKWIEGPGYRTVQANDYSDCEQRCRSDAKCVMLEFYRPSSKCSLYDERRARLEGGASDIGLKR